MTSLHRESPFPLNVLFHVLLAEEGDVEALHYGLFDRTGEPIGIAQRRSTALLLERLPPAPARLLDVGMGIGTTLARLTALGYDAEGITPDPHQVAIARSRSGQDLRAHVVSFEEFTSAVRYDAILFQESSQYIDSRMLLRRCRDLAASGARVIVIDEFSTRPVERPDALRRLDHFFAAAREHGFRLEEEIDLSARAAPTVDYFLSRLPRRRDELVAELGVTAEQIEGLIESGRSYREQYRSGAYVYRLLRFRA